MSDRQELPERLRAHLVQELDAVPLATPDAAGARYRLAIAAPAGRRVRRLALAAVVAACAVLLLGMGAFAAGGSPAVVRWIDELPGLTLPATPEPTDTPELPSPSTPVLIAPVGTEPAEGQGESPGAAEHESEPQGTGSEAQSTPEPTGEHESSTPQPSPTSSESTRDGESGSSGGD